MILALAKKELLILRRDLHGVAVLFVMPAMFVVIMALAIPSQNEIDQRKILLTINSVVNNDAYQLFVAFLENDNQVQLSTDSQNVDANIRLLATFNEQNLTQIELAVPQTSNHIERIQIEHSVQMALAKIKLHGLLIDMEIIVNEDPFTDRIDLIESRSKLMPLTITSLESTQTFPSPVQHSVPSWLIFGMFFIVLPFSQTLLKEKQNSTAIRLRSFGVRPFEMILSKLLPYFVINQLQFWSLIAVGLFVIPAFGGEAFHLQGELLNYVFLSIVISFTALGLSSFIAVVVKTQEQAVVVGGGLNLILAALGGIMVPKYLMSAKISPITEFSPMGWGLDAFQQLLLHQKSLSDISGTLFVMVLFSIIMLSIATYIFSRQFRKLGWNSVN